MRYPWEEGILYVGVDPAQLKSAFSAQGFDRNQSRVRECFHIDDIRFAAWVGEWIIAFETKIEFKKVVLLVEYPTWNAGAAATVRAAANVWIRFFKDLYPRKVEVRKVDPNVWQKTFSYRDRPENLSTKEYSLWLSKKVYEWAVETEDEADAAMILEHGRLTPPKTRKKKANP